ncbi:MAG: hypothetical protein ACYDCH_09515 [Gaiellaceae bacterium]
MPDHLSSVPAPVADELPAAMFPAAAAEERRRRVKRLELMLVGGLVVAVGVFAAVLSLTGSNSSNAGTTLVTGNAYTFWLDADKKHVVPQLVAGPNGERALGIDYKPGRAYFTLLQANFVPARNWTQEDELLLDYRGTASGTALQLVVDFTAGNSRFAGFDILDTSAAWRRLVLVLAKPDAVAGRPDWAHVANLRIVGARKDSAGAFRLGDLRLHDVKP